MTRIADDVTERRQYFAMWGWWLLIVTFCGAPLAAILGNGGVAACFASIVAMTFAQIIAGRWDWIIEAFGEAAP